MKPWYKSRTIWANASVVVAAVAQFLPGLKDAIPAGYYPWIFFTVGVLNIYLRTITSEPVKVPPKG